MIQIAPSLLSADFSQLDKDISMLEQGGCDLLHLDVMDGHFVPNITFGPVVIKGIRKLTKLPLDVHLMIEKPENWIQQFVDAGADWISFHIEATNKTEQVIEYIKKNNKKAGIVIKPATPLENILPFIHNLDFVLVMTVNPGFGGQEFMCEPIEKIKKLSKENIKIEVDGGINISTAPQVVRAGATILVSGAGIFKTKDPIKAIKELKNVS
ncbi:MAG: ribulose-phosphate 3-epimerase [bacterium]|nr:ribulose-phosphate 3-epimerase [bacterium]